ncbi:MAG: nuclear transport factor 2 family protein [Microbacterium sp.]|jgi:ketosteroid isomerase-like protein|nr:nuclear transport factor 2 family protein [Microbacterium sp.]
MGVRELVEKLLRHIGEGDAEAAAALFAERVDFSIPHDASVWWIPPVRTRTNLAAFFTQLPAELDTERFDVDHIIVDGSHAVVLGRMTDTVRRTGKSFTSPFALHVTEHEGALTRYHFLEDTAAVRAAARD